jgi:putative peptidoglycan lipid II flippase
VGVFKATFVVGFFTLLSRVGGFIRDALMLSLIGVGPVMDAFIIAFKFPNFFRRISAEGAFSAAFVPLYSGLQAKQANAFEFAKQAFVIMAIILTIFVTCFEIFTPELMGVFAPGLLNTPDRFQMAVDFTRITFPYILFISLASLMGGVLNSLGKFAAWSAAPILLNVIMIASMVMLAPFVGGHGMALAWGVFVAGIAQFIWLWVILYRNQYTMTLVRPQLTDTIKILFRKMGPGIIGAGVFQINVFVDIWMGSFLAVGGLTYIHVADRLNQLPLSVIGIAISTAFLPTLSGLFQTQKHQEATQELRRALTYAILITAPAATALFLLSLPITKVLFQRGAFTMADSIAIAATLEAFVIGLPAYVLAKVLSNGFFARQDTTTPVVIGIISVLTNFCLNLLFIKSLAHVGIALATALSSWVNVILLTIMLKRAHISVLDRKMRMALMKILICCAAMAAALKLSYDPIQSHILDSGGFTSWIFLTILILLGSGVYFSSAHLMRLMSFAELRGIFRRRKS